jgi:hypothetical protein
MRKEDLLFEAKLHDETIEQLERIGIKYADLRRKVSSLLNWYENEPANMVYFIEKERQRCYLKTIEVLKGVKQK